MARSLLIAAMAGLWLLGLVPPVNAAEMLELHPEVWSAYQSYLQTDRPGAFAVSRGGAVHGQDACPSVMCNLGKVKREALRNCRNAGASDCVVFAVRDDIQLGYRVMSAEEASICPLAPVPSISVELDSEETRFSHLLDVDGLAAMMVDDERHWIDQHGTFMGVTSQSFGQNRRGVRYARAAGKNGVTCAGYEDGTIRLTLAAIIYIAREIPEDTCLYREVMVHERRHEALGAEMMAEFARELEATIAAALAEQPWVEVPAGEQAWRVAADRLDAIIESADVVFDRDHSRRQLAIDSNEEYERTGIVCPGETEKYLPETAEETPQDEPEDEDS